MRPGGGQGEAPHEARGIVIVVVALTPAAVCGARRRGPRPRCELPRRARKAQAIITAWTSSGIRAALCFGVSCFHNYTTSAAIVPVPSERCDHPWEDLGRQGLTP